MLRFECDYGEGAHQKVMERLLATNYEQTPGYGMDDYCEAARSCIRKLCDAPNAMVQFVVGGTQANLLVIQGILRPHQGVLTAAHEHIDSHETGSIEATGHKVLALPSDNGKITAAQVQAYYDAHYADATREHTVQPGMVYIAYPTQEGILYTKEELTELSNTCRKLKLPLFLDGARLGYGLAAEVSDLTLPDLARLCDVFYIGGTKVGALFGEAVVMPDPAIMPDFRYYIKQRGAMFAKGRLLGLQFLTLLEDGLYFDIAKKAVEQALRIKQAFLDKGFSLYRDSYTNQQFPILPNAVLAKLGEKYAFSFWGDMGNDTAAVRFCTSWATKDEDVEALIQDIEAL